MALYAADNISKAVKNFEDRSYARVFGIVLNHRNVENETEKVETFAKSMDLTSWERFQEVMKLTVVKTREDGD